LDILFSASASPLILNCFAPTLAQAYSQSMKALLTLLASLFLFCVPVTAEPAAPAADDTAPVYVIPIEGQIEGALLYVIRRGLAEADAKQAAAVILVMDTPGGALKATGDIIASIQASDVPVYTFVNQQAFSAGAIIALSTKAIYMAPGSVIGDALPIMISPIGGVQEMSESVEEKAVSAVAAQVRSAAQSAGHNPELAEKMVRRELEFKIGDKVISPAGHLLTLTSKEASQPDADGKPLLSAGTLPDLPAVIQALGLSGRPIVTMQITSTEKIARLIAGAAPILMMLGFLGIYIEIKTPGFGLPGILGAVCLALFFWGHHIAGLAGMEDLILLVLGILLLLVEILLIPGFGITGILGICFIFISLVGAMVRIVPGGPLLPPWEDLMPPLRTTTIAFVGTGAIALILGKFLPKSRLFGRLTLSSATRADEGYTASPDTTKWIGSKGIALTDLHPVGAARIDGQRLDVVTSGEYINKDEPVEIIEAHGNRLVVKKGLFSDLCPFSS
jgi:membrane-bound serine protease (ClpP class)